MGKTLEVTKPAQVELSYVQLMAYDYIIVFFSGGKDSIACVLHLLERGVPASKIELWHHDVDGREGSKLMDWACTRDYCRKFAEAFGMKIYFSWREGGFEREMCRNNQETGDIFFEDENHKLVRIPSRKGERYQNTRLKFPQVSQDLSVRWCSPYLKIDVAASAIRNQDRFMNKRTLVISGERGQESEARGNYSMFEPDRADLRHGKTPRYVDHYRPIRDLLEAEIWALIKKYRIRPHPAYRLGVGRVSCIRCIFADGCQLALANHIDPAGTEQVMKYEDKFQVTIKHKISVRELIAKADFNPNELDPKDVEAAKSEIFKKSIILGKAEEWVLPKGAFKDTGCGPR